MSAEASSVTSRAFLLGVALLCGCGSSGTSNAGGASPDADGGGSNDGGTPISLGQPEQGVATYYAADGSGNCSFDPSPNDLNVAAMDAAEYDGSAVCGECVSVTGPKGQVTVRIVDQCPGCEKGHLDLSQQAFAQIADVSAGRVPITWEVVACDVTGPIAYHFKDGSSQYWTAIQVRNHRLPIAKLEWMSGSAWTDIPRQSYNYFVVSSGVGPGSFQVRATAIDGQTLVDTLPPVQANATINGSAQFQ
jgi:expansin (peptidoglycan-binding protein)